MNFAKLVRAPFFTKLMIYDGRIMIEMQDKIMTSK